MDQPRHDTVVTDLPGDRWLVSLGGEHDMTTAEDLSTKLRGIFRTGTTVVVDLTATTFLDSSTLGVLVRAEEYAREHRCERVGVVAPKGGVADRLFALAGVHRMFPTFETAEDAFAFFESADPDSEARLRPS
jgi:anti-sigma B factor antagonist